MKGIKQEWLVFKTHKNLMVIIFAIFVMLLNYQNQERSYRNTYAALYNSYSDSMRDAKDYVTQYTSAYDEINNSKYSYNDKRSLKDKINMWKDLLNKYSELTILLQTEDSQYDELIQYQIQDIDQAIKQYKKTGLQDEEIANLYQTDDHSLQARELKHEVYGNKPWFMSENKPTVVNLLLDACSLTSISGLILLLVIILINYDMWSNDFETHAYRLLFLNAGSRKKIYLRRLLCRFLFTFASLAFILAVYLGYGGLRYGSGITAYYIANEAAFANFANTFQMVSPSQDVLLQGTAILFYACVLLLLYVFHTITFTTFLSLILKQGMLTFLLLLLMLVYNNLNAIFLQPVVWNPLTYIQLTDILQGSYGVSIMTVYGVLLGFSSMFSMLGYWYLQKNDLR